jgi:rubrerythrin
MIVLRSLFSFWKKVLKIPTMTDQDRLLEILQTEYRDEAQDVMQITHHAQYMYYPHFREKLLHIAAEEAEHVRWFAEKIRELGGELPQIIFSPKLGKNSWECLRMTLDEEKQDRRRRTFFVHHHFLAIAASSAWYPSRNVG